MPKDVRRIKTERDIQTAFLDLLKTKKFRQITIADICQQSLTSRSTFYSHYLDKYDLLDKMVAHYSTMFTQEVRPHFQLIIDGNFDELMQSIWVLLDENQQAIHILFTVHEPEADLKVNFQRILHNGWKHYIEAQSLTQVTPIDLIADMAANLQMTLLEWVIQHGSEQLPNVISSFNALIQTIRPQIIKNNALESPSKKA